MNLLTHDSPHGPECRGCILMDEIRRDIEFKEAAPNATKSPELEQCSEDPEVSHMVSYKRWPPKGRKRDLAAQELAESVRRYVKERQNPVSDFRAERAEYERMIGALEAYEDIP